MKMKKYCSFLMIFLLAAFSRAQNFTGNLETVQKNGLTKIKIEPELRSALNNNWNYFRIFDSKNNEIPYVKTSEVISDEKNSKENLEITAVTTIPNLSTSIIISNPRTLNLDHLNLIIANTDVLKTYSISGSNDQNQWYGLVFNQTVGDLQSSSATKVEKEFRFPLNNYRFIKFDFVDKKSLPIQIISASVNTGKSGLKSDLIILKDFTQNITQDKTSKTTIIDIQFNAKQVIEGLKFNITAPEYYLRDATIFVENTRKVNGTVEQYFAPLTGFQLNSSSQNKFQIGELFEKKLRLEIQNEDNLPLNIAGIEFFQESVSLISNLNAGENYRIVVDSTLLMPKYDLSYFDQTLNTAMPETAVINLTKVKSEDSATTEKTFWSTPLFMWLCIGLALLIIGYFSMGLLKDLGKSE